jgi:FkbM family methyltransferase
MRSFLYSYAKSLREGRIDTSCDYVISVHKDMRMTTMANDQGISTELLVFGKHEPLVTRLVKSVVKEGMVCMDIGSNIGYYALLEGRIVGARGSVFAIEPSSSSYRYLERNVALNHLENTFPKRFAVSDVDSFVRLETGSRSNLTRVVDAQFVTQKTEEVPSKKIDSFVAEAGIERIDFLRMDIEGHECNAILGARDSLAKWRPAIVVEVHRKLMGESRTIQLLVILRDLGYEARFFVPRQRDHPYLGRKKDTLRTDILRLMVQLKTNSHEVRSNTFTLCLENTKRAQFQ